MNVLGVQYVSMSNYICLQLALETRAKVNHQKKYLQLVTSVYGKAFIK
jgi:hypothetical protein